MPRGQFDHAAANAKRAATIAAKRKPARKADVIQIKAEPIAHRPRLYIEVEFDDVWVLMDSKDKLRELCKEHGTLVRIEAHGLPPVVKFTP